MQAGPPSAPARGSGVAEAALKGLCPRCRAKSLFRGVADFAPRCRACQLDFNAFNVGDGPAAFLTLLVGALITGLAIALELTVEPAWWVHLLLWLPITAAAVAGSLRVAKGMLITLEYRNSAREGRMTGKE
ncbi:MAG: DUF983 domain-containing protein [Pseudomonadota bacterium]|nr:DUF983 domain-containing protein [Pseudomonadota bacterium]